MRKLTAALAALICLVLAGCASVNGLLPSDATAANTLQISGKSYDDVWNAALKATRARTDLQLIAADRNAGIIRAESGGLYRHNFALFISNAAPGSSTLVVRAVSGQKGGPVALTDYAAAVLMNMRVELGML